MCQASGVMPKANMQMDDAELIGELQCQRAVF